APHTNGTLNACLSTWCASSAGVNTSLSSTKSTPSSSRIWASAKWPMRHFAITGMETAAMISRIFLGEAMRATPPSARICAGTRSSAITAAAPACSAMVACSALVTSMITPPFSISARPVFSRRLLAVGILIPQNRAHLPRPLLIGRGAECRRFSILLCACGGAVPYVAGEHPLRIDGDKHRTASRQHFAALVADFRYVYVYPPANAALVAFSDESLAQWDWLQIFDFHRLGEGHHRAQFVHLAHGLIQNRGDDSAMGVSRRSLIAARQAKAAPGAALGFVKIKFKMHALRIGRPTGKAAIGYSRFNGLAARLNVLSP